MYVGLALVLLGWAVFLSSIWALVGLLFFVLYISRFQIVPEEHALTHLFGDAYTAYCTQVRRWL
jgi:protein-S-isoprenylcysteine O-methyltransferase Ste14